MKIRQFSKIVLIALFCASTLQVSESHALAITNDIKSGITNVKNWFNDLKDLKVVQDTISFAQKTSAAIGDAKESISEYAGDVAKEIAEKKKMYDDYKAQVDEYKEEYEEYKKEYEEYKKMAEDGVQQAKDMKDQATGAIDAAKGMASAASDIAGSKIDGIKDKTGIGSSSNGSGNSTQNIANAAGAVGGTAGAASGAGAVAAGAAAGAAINTAAETTPTSSRTPFTGVEPAVQPVKINSQPVETIAQPNGSTGERISSENLSANVKNINNLSDANVVQAVVENNSVVSKEASATKTGSANGAVSVGAASAAAIKSNLKAQALQQVEADSVQAVSTVNTSTVKTKATIVNPNTTRSIQQRLDNNVKTISPTRKVFSKEKLSFLKPENEYRSYASIQSNSPLAFALLASLGDNGTDINKNFIIPKPLAKRCGLTSKTALESTGRNKYAIDECLVSINDAGQGAQTVQFKNPLQDYYDGKREIAIVYMIEGYKALSDTQKMTEDILPSIEFAQTDTAKDIYSQIVETNKAVVTTISGLLKVYTTKTLLETYNNYDLSKYDFRTQSDD